MAYMSCRHFHCHVPCRPTGGSGSNGGVTCYAKSEDNRYSLIRV